MNITYLADVQRTAWLNGGGFKRDLLKTDGVLISVADITRDGPFSFYDDRQRFFAVLNGAGVLLGNPAVTLTAQSPVHEFAGEDAPECHLINGETLDLNLMVKRSRIGGNLVRLPNVSSGHLCEFEASASPGMFGVFVMGSTILTKLDSSELHEHVLSLPCLVWQPISTSKVRWALKSSEPNEYLNAFSFYCKSRI